MIEALKAGGSVPDAYYKESESKGYNYIKEV